MIRKGYRFIDLECGVESCFIEEIHNDSNGYGATGEEFLKLRGGDRVLEIYEDKQRYKVCVMDMNAEKRGKKLLSHPIVADDEVAYLVECYEISAYKYHKNWNLRHEFQFRFNPDDVVEKEVAKQRAMAFITGLTLRYDIYYSSKFSALGSTTEKSETASETAIEVA